MLAVIVNCVSVIIGSLIGLLFSKRISKNMSTIIRDAAGVIVIILGLQMALQFKNVIYLSLSLLLGGIIGSAINLDDKIFSFGNNLEKLFFKNNNKKFDDNKSEKNFGYAFLNASCLFCVGAMAILGSFEAGIHNNYTIIFTKSILDGFMAITFAASMGVGTLFSFVAIFIYQGLLTLLSTLISPFVTSQMLSEVTGCGGAMIIMIGLNLLGLKKIKTANFLPGILFVILFVLCEPYFFQIKNFVLNGF